MTTRRDLQETVERINRTLVNVRLEWAYGRPRLYDASGSRDLSPRLPTGQMAQWLSAFETGIYEYLREQRIRDSQP